MSSGRALVRPIVKGTYERNDGFENGFPNETKRYADFLIKWVKDYRRAIEYLESRDDIFDMKKVGYIGSSWGALNGLIIPAVEDRLTVSVCYAGGLAMQKALSEVDQINYVTRVKIPTLWMIGQYDTFFPYKLSGYPAFRLLGTAENDKRLRTCDSGHILPPLEREKETLDFLRDYWGEPQ